jgi:REP element-mobilizing transposase RayT
MPDHVHLIVNFSDRSPMADLIGDWKRWLASTHGIQWQKNFFDHRLRNDDEVGQKAAYVLLNPVRAGLVARSEDWPYSGVAQRLLPNRRKG